MRKSQAIFYKVFEIGKGDGGRLEPSWCTIQIKMCGKLSEQKRSEVAAKFVLEVESRAKPF